MMDWKQFDISQCQLIIVSLLVIIPLIYELCPFFRYFLKMALVYSWYFGQTTVFIPFMMLQWKDVNNTLVMAYLMRPLGILLGIKYHVIGKDILENEEPCIYICNHQSSLDVIGMAYIWRHIKHCSVVAKKELLYTGPFGFMCWLSRTVFINRLKSDESRNILNKQIAQLKAEKIKLWIFPEGTRNHSENEAMLPFKKGAFHLAIQAKIPIVPVVFSSYSQFYDKKKMMFKSGGTISIKVLPPVSTDGVSAADIPSMIETVRDSMLEVYKAISENGNAIHSGEDAGLSGSNDKRDS